MSEARIKPLHCGPLENQPHHAIRFVNPDDGGRLGTVYFEPLDMILRPSSGCDETASLFVGDNLVHIPKADAPQIAAVLLRAAGWEAAGSDGKPEDLDAHVALNRLDILARRLSKGADDA